MLFANDTTFYASGKNLYNLLPSTDDIEGRAESWYNDNKIKLNKVKTQKFTMTSHTNTQIRRIKLIGIHNEDSLNWSTHYVHYMEIHKNRHIYGTAPQHRDYDSRPANLFRKPSFYHTIGKKTVQTYTCTTKSTQI